MDRATDDGAEFAFRPWVARSCRKAMSWGIGVVLVFAVVAYMLRTPGSVPLSRAFGVLVLYGSLFWLSLVKIWWTASNRPAVRLDDEYLAYQPLHLFRPKRLRLADVSSCGLRKGTMSLRFVHSVPNKPHKGDREFFLNLAVIAERGEFMRALGERLRRLGLTPDPEVAGGWRR